MNETVMYLLGIRITAWKVIGYLGVLMFSSRWLVQLLYSRKKGYSAMPTLFWLMSIAGSLFCLLYFIFGKNDSVGIVSYFFPMCVAGYNLYLNRQHKKKKRRGNVNEEYSFSGTVVPETAAKK